MTPGYKYRTALFICLLLIGEEFTRARHLNKKNDIEPTNDETSDGDDYTAEEVNRCKEIEKEEKGRSNIPHLINKLHRQSLEEEGGGKKGWIAAAKLLFKGVKIFSTGVNFVLAGAQIAHSIKMAIVGCCDAAHEDECAYKEKFEAANADVTALSRTADKLQVDAEIAQMWIEKTTDRFAQILEQLERIDAFEDKLIQEISPDVYNATEKATERIKQLIAEKNNTLKGILFADVDQLYQSTMDKALGIGGSVLSLAVPGLFTVWQYSRHKARMRRLGYIELQEDVDFKLPKKSSSSSSLYEAAKFNRWTARRWRTNFRPKDLIKSIKNSLKRSFRKIKEYGAKFLDVIGTVANLAMAGYTIYNMIKQENQCADTRQKIKCAYILTKESHKTIQGHIDEIKNVSTIMNNAWGFIRGNLTDEMLLKSLNQMKIMMAGASRQSEETQIITDDIYGFLDEIKTSDNFNITYDASTKLMRALGKIPYSFKCYTAKVNTLNGVIKGCKEGDKTMNMLIKESKYVPESKDPNDVKNPRNCRDRLGFLYIEDKDVKEAWYKVADEQGYNNLCLMNKPLNREYICKKMKEDLLDAKTIANNMNWDDVEGVQEIMNILKNTFSPGEKRLYCMVKEMSVDKADFENNLQGMFEGSLEHILELASDVECPQPEDKPGEKCIPEEVFPPKQLERERKESR